MLHELAALRLAVRAATRRVTRIIQRRRGISSAARAV
jgi:hypothetical protein